MKKSKSKLDWFKKNIVIVPVVGAILAGTFTSVRYVLTMTDTIQINKEILETVTRDLEIQKEVLADIKNRLDALSDKNAIHSSLNPNIPNAALWIKQNILKADAATAEANLVLLENKDTEIKNSLENKKIREDLKKEGELNEVASREVMKLINGIGRSLSDADLNTLKANHGAVIQLIAVTREPDLFKQYIQSIDTSSDPVITTEIKQAILDELEDQGV